MLTLRLGPGISLTTLTALFLLSSSLLMKTAFGQPQPAPGWYRNSGAGGTGSIIFEDARLRITWENSYIYPTLSTLSGRNLIKTADLLSKQTEDVDLHIVETFNEIMHLPLYRHSDAVNAFQQLENPT
jgi:hypothetical protein